MEYIYRDADGAPSSKVVRKGDKKFHIEHYNGQGWALGRNGAPHIPYRLNEVLAANRSKTVYVCEGERDVDAAWSEGLIATCNQGGAGKWIDEDSQYLASRDVVIVYDLDEAGARHAIKVHDSLVRCGAKSVRFKHAREGNDFSDHVNGGYTVKQLVIEHPTKLFPEANEPKPVIEPGDDFGYLPSTLQLVLMKLDAVTKEGGKEFQFNARCPAHDDHSPSLSISLGENGQVLLKCQAGCDFYKIANELKINPQDLTRKQLGSEHDTLVEKKLTDIRARDDAMAIRNTELAGNVEDVRKLTKSVYDKLAEPQRPAKFLIDGLIRDRGRVLLSAQPKAGKTRFLISLLKAVADREESFLGRRVIVPDDGSVLWSNLDMDSDMSYDWLEQAGIRDQESFLVVDGDGYTLPIWEPAQRKAHIELIREHNVCLWVIDTLIAAAQGLITNENDNIEWYKFFNAINQIRVEAGWPAVISAHHTSRADDLHARGASAIEGWFAELWYLTVEGGDDARFSQDAPRVLRVQGRDGHIAAAQLAFNMGTGLYSYGGLSAREQRKLELLAACAERVMEWFSTRGVWPSKGEARSLMLGVKGPARDKWLDEAVERGFLHQFRDGRAIRYKV